MKSFVFPFSLLVLGCCLFSCGHKFTGTIVNPPRVAQEISAVNWDKKTFRLSDHRGKVVSLFFGYTYCPDICPGSFAKMRKLYGKLADKARDVVVVFVSVDRRDTQEKLASYVSAFHPNFYGLLMEDEKLARIMEAYEVRAEKRYGKGLGGKAASYRIDHTSSFILIDKAGRLREKIPFDAPVEGILADVEYLLNEEIGPQLGGKNDNSSTT